VANKPWPQCLAVCLARKGKCLWYYICIVSALAEQWIVSAFEVKNVPLTHLTDALAKLALHPIYSLADLLPAVTAICLQFSQFAYHRYVLFASPPDIDCV